MVCVLLKWSWYSEQVDFFFFIYVSQLRMDQLWIKVVIWNSAFYVRWKGEMVGLYFYVFLQEIHGQNYSVGQMISILSAQIREYTLIWKILCKGYLSCILTQPHKYNFTFFYSLSLENTFFVDCFFCSLLCYYLLF